MIYFDKAQAKGKVVDEKRDGSDDEGIWDKRREEQRNVQLNDNPRKLFINFLLWLFTHFVELFLGIFRDVSSFGEFLNFSER